MENLEQIVDRYLETAQAYRDAEEMARVRYSIAKEWAEAVFQAMNAAGLEAHCIDGVRFDARHRRVLGL